MIRSRRLPGASIDPACPLDWSHPLNVGLVSDWTIVPNSGWRGGVTLRDLVRGGRSPNDGALTNGPTWAGSLGCAGAYGGLKFTAASSQYAEGTIPAALSATGSWTLVTRVFLNSLPANIIFGCPGADNGASIGDGFAVGVNNGAGTATGSALVGLLPGVTWLNPAFTIPAGVWFTAGITRIGTTIQIYYNGQPVGSTFSSSPKAFTANSKLRFSGQAQNTARYIDGAGNAILLYNRGLAAPEMFSLNEQLRRGNPERFRWIGTRAWSIPTGAAPGRTADLAVTLGALTASADATHPDTADLAQTLGAATASSAATNAVKADAAVTLGAAALAASATNAVAAALVQTLGGLAAAAAGTHPVTADLGVTLGACTLAAQAGVPFSGGRRLIAPPRRYALRVPAKGWGARLDPRRHSLTIPRG